MELLTQWQGNKYERNKEDFFRLSATVIASLVNSFYNTAYKNQLKQLERFLNKKYMNRKELSYKT